MKRNIHPTCCLARALPARKQSALHRNSVVFPAPPGSLVAVLRVFCVGLLLVSPLFCGSVLAAPVDSDGDTISDVDEGPAGTDTNGNATPDSLDLDSDGDGLSDALEAGDADLNTPPVDTDKDGTPDFRDWDSDDDELPDALEDPNGNGIIDPGETDPRNPDMDGDGAPDGVGWPGAKRGCRWRWAAGRCGEARRWPGAKRGCRWRWAAGRRGEARWWPGAKRGYRWRWAAGRRGEAVVHGLAQPGHGRRRQARWHRRCEPQRRARSGRDRPLLCRYQPLRRRRVRRRAGGCLGIAAFDRACRAPPASCRASPCTCAQKLRDSRRIGHSRPRCPQLNTRCCQRTRCWCHR